MEEQASSLKSPPSSSRGRRQYSVQEKLAILKALSSWEGSHDAFCLTNHVAKTTLNSWQHAYAQKGVSGLEFGGGTRGKGAKKAKRYPPDQKRQAVEAFSKSGQDLNSFAKLWGVNPRALQRWLAAYRDGGPKALERKGGRKPGKRPLAKGLRDEIVEVKTQFPEFGLRKVRDFLSRFRGLKASPPQIRRVVQEEKLPQGRRAGKRWKKKPVVRRFERSKPGELWQSDITSFVLPRYSQRVYLVAFMDDYSRYVVSWKLGLKQTGEFVEEALLDGIQRFGKPLEVLTDQGRQYFAWRGRSDFQRLLEKQGIRHVVSRTHHPETLGKCERFWKTVGEEFWSRVQPQELSEAQERLAHFISHYNHFRPHQGLDGSVPADRFFGAESQVRKVIEETMSQNQLALAIDEPLRRPVFLVGQIGEHAVSLHGERGRLVLQTPEGVLQEVAVTDLGMSQSSPKPLENSHERDTVVGPESGPAANPEKAPLQAHGETQDGLPDGHPTLPGENLVGASQQGRTGESALLGSAAAGTLAGPDDARTAGGEIESAAAAGLAAEPAGAGSDGDRLAQAAQEPTQGDAASPGDADERLSLTSQGEREAPEGERAAQGVGERAEGSSRESRPEGAEGRAPAETAGGEKNQPIQPVGNDPSEPGCEAGEIGRVTLPSSPDNSGSTNAA